MTLLYLIRHGRSTWNAEGRVQGQADPPLDETGREQARKLSKRLNEIEFEAFYSSPLARARETAKIVAEPHDMPIAFDDRLMERSFGDWTGLHGSQLDEYVKKAEYRNWRLDGAPNGESRIQIINRAAAVFGEIVATHPEETVAVVSHGGLLSVFISHALEMPLQTTSYIHFGNTAIARIRIEKNQIHVISINDDSHLHSD